MSDETIYPYQLNPKLTEQIWGGDALVGTYHKHGDPARTYGESWECWDTDTVINGPLQGSSVADLRAKLGAKLLGTIEADRIFPVLTKIIDARDWLSVQVHPDDAYAQRVEHQPFGKTECWFVFSAEPGSELVLGWTQATTRAEYERRVADGTLGAILRRVPVKAGDTFYLPSGMLHAIGKGIVVYETQQASDLTYRIFDWNRVGTDGKPRELAVKKAGDVLYYGAGTEKALEQIPYRFEGLSRTALIADPRFTVERVVATAEAASLSTGNRPLIITALERAMQIEAGGVTVEAGAYTTTLIPAAAQWCSVRAPGDDAPFMLVTPPADPEQLPVQLLAAGIDQTRVDRFMAQFHPLGVKA